MKLKLKAELIEKDFHKRTKIESCHKTFLREKKIKKLCQNKVKFPIMHQLHHIQGLRGKST